MTKNVIRQESSSLLSEISNCRFEEIQQTGGSAGVPTTIYKSGTCQVYDSGAKLRAYFANGYRITDKIAVAHHAPPRKKFFHRLGIHREYDVPANYSTKQQFDLIQKIGAEVIDAQPNRVELLARYAIEHSLNLESVKLIFTHGEKLTDMHRCLVRQKLCKKKEKCSRGYLSPIC